MAILGAGSGTGFPGVIDTAQTYANIGTPDPDDNTRVDAAFANDIMAAILALEAGVGRLGTANTWTADQTLTGVAPILNFISTNNSSGARYDTTGTATTAAHRFQYNGTTLVHIAIDGKTGIGMTPTQQFELSGSVGQKASGTTWSNPSDARLKDGVLDYTDGLDVIRKIRPVRYTLNGLAGTPKGTKGISVIAQEMLEVMPYTIETYTAKLHPEDMDDTELYRFEASALTFALVNAVKELATRLEAVEAWTH